MDAEPSDFSIHGYDLSKLMIPIGSINCIFIVFADVNSETHGQIFIKIESEEGGKICGHHAFDKETGLRGLSQHLFETIVHVSEFAECLYRCHLNHSSVKGAGQVDLACEILVEIQ